MFGELLGPHYLKWLFDGFLLTLALSAVVCLVATGLGFLVCLASGQLAPGVLAGTGLPGVVS